jgi:hypothetical protein
VRRATFATTYSVAADRLQITPLDPAKGTSCPYPSRPLGKRSPTSRSSCPNAKKAVEQFEALLARLEAEEDFRKLWNTDSAKALMAVNIDPQARQEIGLGPYERGPECNNCITPMGNACHR